MKPVCMDLESVVTRTLVITSLNLCVCLCFGNTSCCYSSLSYLLVLQRACKCHPLFPRHWGNQPWHTRKLWFATCCSRGMVGNLMSIQMPSTQLSGNEQVPKYRQQTHLSITSRSHSEKSANTLGIRNKSH